MGYLSGKWIKVRYRIVTQCFMLGEVCIAAGAVVWV